MSAAVLNHHEAATERFLLSSLRLPTLYRPALSWSDPRFGERHSFTVMAPLFAEAMDAATERIAWWQEHGDGSEIVTEALMAEVSDYEEALKSLLVACGLRPYDGPPHGI
jgi:hypothetical protein